MKSAITLIICLQVVALASTASTTDNQTTPKQEVLSARQLEELHELLKNTPSENKEQVLEKFISTLPKSKQEQFRKEISERLTNFNKLLEHIRVLISKVLNEQQQKDLETMIVDLHNKNAKLDEQIKAVHEFLVKKLGNEKATELFDKIDEALKANIPQDKAEGFFGRIKHFFQHLFH